MSDKSDRIPIIRRLGIGLFAAIITVCVCFVVINVFWIWFQNRPIPPPDELLSGTSDLDKPRSYRVIYERDGLQRLAGVEDNIKVVMAEVTLGSTHLQRRAYLEIDRSESVYLGTLHAIPDAGPVEFLFFQINGTRMAIAWVDPTLTSSLEAVSIVRSEQRGDVMGDDAPSRLSDGPARQQSAFIALRDSDRWVELTEIRVSSGDSVGYRYVQKLSPPYPLTSEFEQHSIVWP